MAKINGNEIRPGFVLEHDGGLWAAVKVNHVKPGKGGAFAQVELKNLRDGRKLNERFRSEDKVDQVQLDNKDQQFLYETDGKLVFMDNETFEQIEIDAELLGDRRPFLQDGMMATVEYYGDEALSLRIPQKVKLPRGRDRAGAEGPDGRKQLQARDPRQRRADHDPAVHRTGRGHHRAYRTDGILGTRLIEFSAKIQNLRRRFVGL